MPHLLQRVAGAVPFSLPRGKTAPPPRPLQAVGKGPTLLANSDALLVVRRLEVGRTGWYVNGRNNVWRGRRGVGAAIDDAPARLTFQPPLPPPASTLEDRSRRGRGCLAYRHGAYSIMADVRQGQEGESYTFRDASKRRQDGDGAHGDVANVKRAEHGWRTANNHMSRTDGQNSKQLLAWLSNQ